MPESPNEKKPARRKLENVGMFVAAFLVSEVFERVGDAIHNPEVTDIPNGTGVVLGLGIAALSTTIFDRLNHAQNLDE